jgi:glycosyltransferase involved in cell wall biosynthesis
MAHICLVAGSFARNGGTERAAANFCKQARLNGYNISLISLFGDEKLIFDFGPSVSHHVLLRGRNSVRFNIAQCWSFIYKFAHNKQVDFILAVESLVSLYTLMPCILARKTHITWEHFNFLVTLGRPQRLIARILSLYLSDYTVVLTQQDKDLWSSFPFRKTILLVIPNCIDPDFIRDITEPSSSKSILAVGRLVPQKGFDILIKAFKLISSNNPEWSLVIVGDGRLKPNLISQIAKLQLDHCVKLHNSTEHISNYYTEHSIFCLSSRFEGFGLVLIEAMAFGMPAVAFDCMAGPREILEGTSSLLVRPPRNHKSLAFALNKLINNRELLSESRRTNYQKAQLYKPSKIFELWDKNVFGA